MHPARFRAGFPLLWVNREHLSPEVGVATHPTEPVVPPATAKAPGRRLRFKIVLAGLLSVSCVAGALVWRNSRADVSRSESLRDASQGRFSDAEQKLKA